MGHLYHGYVGHNQRVDGSSIGLPHFQTLSCLIMSYHDISQKDANGTSDFLVGGLEHLIFSPIVGMMIQSDFHIFQGGRSTIIYRFDLKFDTHCFLGRAKSPWCIGVMNYPLVN